jgi:hypothetical protein
MIFKVRTLTLTKHWSLPASTRGRCLSMACCRHATVFTVLRQCRPTVTVTDNLLFSFSLSTYLLLLVRGIAVVVSKFSKNKHVMNPANKLSESVTVSVCQKIDTVSQFGHGHGHGLFIKTRVTAWKVHTLPPSCPGCYADLFRAPLHEVLPKPSPPLHVLESLRRNPRYGFPIIVMTHPLRCQLALSWACRVVSVLPGHYYSIVRFDTVVPRWSLVHFQMY